MSARLFSSLLVGCSAAVLASACGIVSRPSDFWNARRDSSGQAPIPEATPGAVVQVYAARAVGWRGLFGVHTWITAKRAGAPGYRRWEVMGWRVAQGATAVRVDRTGPDNYWFGARPVLLVDLRGEGVDAVIDKIETAVRAYPYPDRYHLWPGPNSNTFTAFVGRRVPELRLKLPPTAVGKDFLPGRLVAAAPSGRGVQLSLFGILGVLAALDDGVEINVLGLTFGVDVMAPALKLPIAGRLGFPELSRRD
jgi:Protein of unknown function (DUF3750)